jgi:glutaredoxin-like protein NrdH
MNTITVTLYTKPGCGPCIATKHALDAAGIHYQTIDLDTNLAAVEHIKRLGYLQAPIIITPTDHWSGYRPDKLSELIDAPIMSVGREGIPV